MRTLKRVFIFMMPPYSQRYRRYADRVHIRCSRSIFAYIPTPTKFCAVWESLAINQYSTGF